MLENFSTLPSSPLKVDAAYGVLRGIFSKAATFAVLIIRSVLQHSMTAISAQPHHDLVSKQCAAHKGDGAKKASSAVNFES